MPCNINPEQSKEYFKDPVRRAALWDAALDKYFKNGADFAKTVSGLSDETGHSKVAIMDVLRPQGVSKNLTQDMWAKQYARRQIGEGVKRVAASVGGSRFGKVYGAYDSTTRRITTWGHFTVFGKTHMGDSLWTNPVEYLKNFKNSMQLATKEGIAAHEERMSTMFADDDYKLAVRSNLDVTARSEASQVLGGGKSPRSHAAFEELQLRRFESFKKAMDSLSAEERTAENGKVIAEVINNRTGGGAPGRVGGFFGKFLFGPRLTPAQWRAAFGDNVKAVYNGVLNRGNATPGELVAARMTAARMGKLLTVYGGALALEAAYSQATGDKRNMPNLTNPKDTGSFLRLRAFGKGIPLSPTIELIALPIKMIYSAYSAKPGENALVNFASPLVKYAGYRLSPGLALATSLGLGQETFSGRPMPWHKEQLTKKGQPVMSELTKPKLSYTEFLGERMPIPAAVFLRDVYDEMRSNGVDHPTASNLISGAVAAATTGVSGYEWHPDVNNPYKEAEQNTPENASDRQRARILNSAMKGFRRERGAQPPPKEIFGLGP
jgi:hypothetical protein